MDKRDAERALEILWQLRLQLGKNNGEPPLKEDAILSKPISMLQCYLTDVLPATHPRRKLPLDTNIRVEISSDARIQLVEMDYTQASSGGNIGLSLLNYTTYEGRQNYCVSHVEKGSFMEHQDLFKRGDIILSINKHYLSRVSPEKAK